MSALGAWSDRTGQVDQAFKAHGSNHKARGTGEERHGRGEFERAMKGSSRPAG